MISEITSLKNDWVKGAASLKVKKYRQREQLFLLEGKRAVDEARRSSWQIQAYFFTKLPEEWTQEADAGDTPYYQVTEAVMEKITATEDPQGVAALVALKETPLKDFHPAKGLVLVLDKIRDPGNTGTLIRTADALGAAGVILLAETADLYNPKVVRSTMGSLFHLPVFTGVTQEELLNWCRKEQFTLWATALEGAKNVTETAWPQKTALVMGSEAEGVDPALLAQADTKIMIPMAGQAESLNVAIAGGILLFLGSQGQKA